MYLNTMPFVFIARQCGLKVFLASVVQKLQPEQTHTYTNAQPDLTEIITFPHMQMLIKCVDVSIADC